MREIINYQFVAVPFDIGCQGNKAKRETRRANLGDALKAAKAAGLTVKGAVIENGKIELQFAGEVTTATSDDWDSAIVKAISNRRKL